MDWYVYSILAALFFTGMTLCVKKLTTDLKFSSEKILFFLLLFLFIGFLSISFQSLPLVFASDNFLFLLLLTSVGGLFSAIGNWTDFEGIKRAPNAGYAVAIRNFSFVLTIFISTLLFGSEIKFFKLFGAILITAGIIFLIVDKKQTANEKNSILPWYVFSFSACLAVAIVILITKKATLLSTDFSIQSINLFIVGFCLLFLSFFNLKKLRGYFTEKENLKVFFLFTASATVFSFLGNIVKIIGLDLAPNPGYSEAIVKTDLLFITILSAKLFSAKLNKYKLLGIFVILIGLIILAF
ncbi:MAG: EamA family transporter [bacterium]|nr:EamA family transporter [bacterium]